MRLLLSPENLQHLAPRTPASTRSRHRDNSSAYYTAVWGSPYERSLSPTPSARTTHTALSEQTPSEDQQYLSSPLTSFGLEHLIPSRLANRRPSRTNRHSSLSRQLGLVGLGVEGIEQEEDDPHTPRSRTKRWVQLPRRQSVEREKIDWWRDEERSGSERERLGHTIASSSAAIDFAPVTKRRHNSRQENRTLNQQTFLEIVRGGESENMASLYASRWADTPPPEIAEQLMPATEKVMAQDQSENDTTTPPLDKQELENATEGVVEHAADVDGAQEAVEQGPDENSSDDVQPGAQEEASVEGIDSCAQPTPQTPDKRKVTQPARFQADLPKLIRKRYSWRGKTVVACIPDVDFAALGLPAPMSDEERKARLQRFEDDGYDITGFTLSNGADDMRMLAHARAIYPDETDLTSQARHERPNVSLPDLNKAKADLDKIIEAKLAALGVGGVGEEAPLPPASSAIGSRDVLRQYSGQYPPLPFSPPLPTGSAGSVGRPPMLRGHSHTMSVASPISPGVGPFGHMHRHSTFSGPMSFPQLQTQQLPQRLAQHSPIPLMQASLPQTQFAVPGLPRGASPAQLAALVRQDFAGLRGPSSPLSQQVGPSPTEYSRGLMQDQRQRQHGYSQSEQHIPPYKPFVPQMPPVQQTYTLPELPEEDDEEELRESAAQSSTLASGPEPPAYVPPHKRAQINADVAIPTPTRGHRHNISEGLERDLIEAEQRHEAERKNWIEVTTTDGESQSDRTTSKSTTDNDSAKTHKQRPSQFNVRAPSFHFNPTASFQPTAPPFTFGGPASGSVMPISQGHNRRQSSDAFNAAAPEFKAITKGHNRQQSSGNFNVAAPEFKPTLPPAFMPKAREFSFSAQVASTNPTQSENEPVKTAPEPSLRTVIDDLPSIFGKVNIPGIVKPVRKSKAVAIVRPDTPDDSSEDAEDADGRITQGDDRLKRQRVDGDDGDQVPLFAEPTPFSAPLASATCMPSQDQEQEPSLEALEDNDIGTTPAPDDVTPLHTTGNDAVDVAAHDPDTTPGAVEHHEHKPSSSLSALAKPFEPPTFPMSAQDPSDATHAHDSSISELEEGEILVDDDVLSVSPVQPTRLGEIPAMVGPADVRAYDYSPRGRIDQVAHAEPSFDEIDAVMRQLNEAGSSERGEQAMERAISPLPDAEDNVLPGVSYISGWPRSDAPSPSPRRKSLQQQNHDSSFTVHDRTDSGELAISGWPHVHRLNRAEDVPMSDWSGVLSPPDEEKLQHRSAFFDSHIDDIIGRVVEQRLLPIEQSLLQLQHVVVKRASSSDHPPLKRTSSTVESDADDEDDENEDKLRPTSRGRDKRLDQMKIAVLEALREQSPQRSQSTYDLADIHTILADMKVSFARAASASLELEDVRAVVEEAMHRQSQALVPLNEDTRAHKRELSELEGRLNETLAGALEEANHRRDVEERASETQRMLRLAEEELSLLRHSSRDDDGRLGAMEDERRELMDRAERAEAKAQEVEQENEALQATLEEYRTSSSKWRLDIDEGARDREELESTVALLERQVEESQDSSTSMRRRLEKLHADMAIAAGQLASEKAAWKAREENYRTRCESLEAAQAAHARERHEMDEELRVLRVSHAEASEDRRAFDIIKTSHSSLEKLVLKLQDDLAEQEAVSARHERNFHDAKEAGRVEVERTRASLVIDVEAANRQVNVVRAELEAELTKVRTELDSVRSEAEIAKARHERAVDEEDGARREVLRKLNLASSVALDEERQRHERTLEDLATQHRRSLHFAVEDKTRSEYILTERLSLSDAKLQHANDRIRHLEERLEITKSAAQAAATSAHMKATAPGAMSSDLPEKISPQALRESILVLQEQLQERETTVDRLQHQLKNEGPALVKEHDSEISWLRELLAMRNEDLTDLVNSLSTPTFDREEVRDIAIRIRANLQMEQQEKERLGGAPGSLSGQAIASLSSFATPKAASLTSAFQKWRSTMESSSLKAAAASRPGPRPRTMTPSRPRPTTSRPPPNYMAGLLTPPASNLRSTPSPEATKSVPAPQLQRRGGSVAAAKIVSAENEEPVTPLLQRDSYDQDAEDNEIHLQHFDDDDLDAEDSQPPAFRSLGAELDTVAGSSGE
ncbi:hypothetical protein LTR62_000386 [Meristemomyces frigidus]|uniref:Uncharacterized protein n=1 Tax=Meristemomyces frigidus TaxID=1508187 RepID=A0AAN7TPB3_9PEZI|nr:hypothetical protein LTR62_000386 [Meristemomyces frigidus]